MRHLVAVCLWMVLVVVTVIHGASGCNFTQFQCDNGQCVSSSFQCDGFRTCSDGSDEMNCISCRSGAFRCSSGTCIRSSYRCNGRTGACSDGSDERNCVSCQRGAFRCSNGQCILTSRHCDGNRDCTDGSDETGCSCSFSQFRCANGRCVSSSLRCNGRTGGCTDGSDERNCRSCRSGAFRCNNGQCIHSSDRCDRNRDCTDGSDEIGCSSSVNIVGIAVGLSVAGFVLYGVLPIVICVIIGCCSARASSRRPRTVFTTATQPATVTVNTKCSQQGDSKSYTPAGTDVKLASRDEMSTYPPPTETSCSPPLYP